MVLVLSLFHGSIRGAGQKTAALETRKVFGPRQRGLLQYDVLYFLIL